MKPALSEKSRARNDSLMTGHAQARRRLGAAVATGVLAFALALPAPRASQVVPAGHATPASATTGTAIGGTTVPTGVDPTMPSTETGCCA